MNKFRLGQKVYIQHPQPTIRSFTIIDATIVGIIKVTEHRSYHYPTFKPLEGERLYYVYTVALSPSGSQLDLNEENIFAELDPLKTKLQKKLEEEKRRLEKEINNLHLVLDI